MTTRAAAVEFVPASHYSLEALTEAYNQTRVDYSVPMAMSPRELAEHVHIYDISLEDSCVASLDGETVGLCMLGRRQRRGWITRLGALPTARRQGIGRGLVERCVARARALGLAELWLEVIVGNTPAHSLFLRQGFVETQRLLILRRPPGAPPSVTDAPISTSWLDKRQLLELAGRRADRAPWTNQTETLANLGTARGLRIVEASGGASGWISYEETPSQLRRIMMAADERSRGLPAYQLLHSLHTRFPTLESVAENAPATSPSVKAFYAHGYVESFARIEMALAL